jgi:hypothetical protein
MLSRIALISLAALLTGCASSSQTTASQNTGTTKVSVVNTKCPVAGGAYNPSGKGVARAYKGSEIGFCCGGCAARFDAMSDMEKDNILNLARADKVMAR